MEPVELDPAIDALRTTFDAPGLTVAGPPRRMTGGFWADVWEVRLDRSGPGGQPAVPSSVVLRVSPDPVLGAWESIVQRGVADMGYPTPRILAVGNAAVGNAAVGGRAWSVMELARGHSLLDGLSGWKALTRLPHLARALPDSLAECAAQLHRLDPTAVADELATTGRGVGVDPMLDLFDVRAAVWGDPALDEALARLRTGRPPDRHLAVCHGDLHPFNLLDDHGTVTVLDWTSSQIADPTYDLAYTVLLLQYPPLEVPPVLGPVISLASGRLARRFVHRYAKTAERDPSDRQPGNRDLPPVDLDRLDWAMRFHVVRILLDVREWLDAGPTHPRYGHPWTSRHSTLRELLTRDRLGP